MKASFFAILLLVIVGVAVALAKDSPNNIPLVTPDVNFTSSSTTYKVGSFMPSGLITPGAYVDWTVEIDKKDSEHALSIYTQYVGAVSTTNPNDTYASVQIFLRKGEAATTTNFVAFANSTCSSGINQTCYGNDNTVCDPAKGTWHITVYNSGNTVATYKFEVAVDEYILGVCAAVGWFEEILKDALATLIMVIIGIVVAIVGCIVSCVYCCCIKNRRQKHAYQLVNSHHDDHDHHHKHHNHV